MIPGGTSIQIGLQTSGIGIATPSSLDLGSWTGHGSIGIPKTSGYNLVDPNHFRESSGAPRHFTFRATPINVAYNSTGSIEEGSDKWYYLSFSSGACCNAPPSLAAPGDEYKIMVCRSSSPTGPFSDQTGDNCLTGNGGTLVLGSHGSNVYAPGGQGVLYDLDMGRSVIYYHYGE
ncbi:glycosyl hydrolase [Cenococcum geophilum]